MPHDDTMPIEFNEYEEESATTLAQSLRDMHEMLESEIPDVPQWRDMVATSKEVTKGRLLAYYSLGMCSEAGEIASKIKKQVRDGIPLDHDALLLECGDVLWYVTQMARLADGKPGALRRVAARNLAKLKDRQNRGAICGEGDSR